jgi:ABC-type amino acid transport system permease subunit
MGWIVVVVVVVVVVEGGGDPSVAAEMWQTVALPHSDGSIPCCQLGSICQLCMLCAPPLSSAGWCLVVGVVVGVVVVVVVSRCGRCRQAAASPCSDSSMQGHHLSSSCPLCMSVVIL